MLFKVIPFGLGKVFFLEKNMGTEAQPYGIQILFRVIFESFFSITLTFSSSIHTPTFNLKAKSRYPVVTSKRTENPCLLPFKSE